MSGTARLGLLVLTICALAAALLLVSPPSSELVGTSKAQVPLAGRADRNGAGPRAVD